MVLGAGMATIGMKFIYTSIANLIFLSYQTQDPPVLLLIIFVIFHILT